LDLTLTVNDNRLVLSPYDKRDFFPFGVRSFPDLTGNLPFRTTHGVIVGQLRRFAICCYHFGHFRERLQGLTRRLLGQGFSQKLLELRVGGFFREQGGLLARYECGEEVFVRSCFGRRHERAGSEEAAGEEGTAESKAKEEGRREVSKQKEGGRQVESREDERKGREEEEDERQGRRYDTRRHQTARPAKTVKR